MSMDDPQTHLASLSNPTSMPDGYLLATYKSRDDVNRAVTRLVEGGVPSSAIFIVGNNIRQLEVIAGKVTYPKAALTGAVSGATFGVFISVIMALVTNTSIVTNALTAIPLGIAFWMLSGVLSVYRLKNKDSFATRSALIAGSYDLLVLPAVAQQARQILGIPGFGMPAQHQPQASAPHQQQAVPPAGPGTGQQVPPPYPQWQKPTHPVPPQRQQAYRPFEPGQYQAAHQRPADTRGAADAAENSSGANFVPPTKTQDQSKFGLRITDPAQYEATVRLAPPAPEQNPVVEAVRNEPPLQKYGKRIEDPAEYEATIRKPDENKQ